MVVDEEHDGSYKQQGSCAPATMQRYRCFYASLFGAKVLLGTATPSMETLLQCRERKVWIGGDQRTIWGIHLPLIEIIDTRQVAKKGR